MKVGIVTLPLNHNYGGILQAYALQWVLKQMGHEPITIDRASKDLMPAWMKLASVGKRFVERNLLRRDVVVRTWPTKKEYEKIARAPREFTEKYVERIFLNSEKEFASIQKRLQLDAYVVGSDQVWRPKYSPVIAHHYLGFLSDTEPVKRLSYAASFGVDHWEYTDQQTEECRRLALRFNAVSVREKQAVDLCEKYLGVKAVHVLDPTMLVGRDHYEYLVKTGPELPALDGTLLNYVLDKDEKAVKMIRGLEKMLGVKTFSTMPAKSFGEVGPKGLEQCVYPPVTNWIRGFMEADFVVTDSFHGTVFSIIFNKPFFSMGNPNRGMARFLSLLEMFGLESRLISSVDQVTEERLAEPIDFEKVNRILETKREESLAFLRSALTS